MNTIKLKSRREFLSFMTNQTVALGLAPSIMMGLSSCVSLSKPKKAFSGIDATFEDDLVLADGLKYNILAKWGDRINKKNEVFGFNNDFTCFISLDGKSDEGLLWVNHESIIPEMVHNKETNQLSRSANEIIKEQELVGGSILHLKKTDDKWDVVPLSKYNRRIHGRTPIPFSDGYVIQGKNHAIGTLANCAGGLTPWGTFLTSEENYDTFYGEAYLNKGKRSVKYLDKYDWYKTFNLPPEHYGWVVEIDPKTGRAEKQVNLGRAPHEGATVAETRGKKTVVYMGEDRPNGYIFKFVGEGKGFSKGTLYAADTVNGRWLALDIEKNPTLKGNFDNQLQVLTYAHQAAELVGATPQDRPEDIEVHPMTGEVFIALTKNPEKNNKYGSLLKIKEAKDFDSLDMHASTWISGGMDSGMACPDNLCFDKRGNLWLTVDMAEAEVGSFDYKAFGNNGLYYIPMYGKGAGVPVQVASAPVDAELTGPCFSDDYQTLFLSIQHPGAGTAKNLKKPTSQWPDGPGKMPRSSVVAIQGDLLKELMG